MSLNYNSRVDNNVVIKISFTPFEASHIAPKNSSIEVLAPDVTILEKGL
jgi:hypothetical protein